MARGRRRAGHRGPRPRARPTSRSESPAAPPEKDDAIRKFEEIGTQPEANFLTVAGALTLHRMIGPKRKEARLVYLRDDWAKPLVEHDRVRLHTSLEPERACGIATVEIRGLEPGDLYSYRWGEHSIRTTPIAHDEFRGIRVSPSVCTTTEELDRFVAAMEAAVREGVPMSITREKTTDDLDPTTLEDRLLDRYREEYLGELFLEVPAGGGDASYGRRRIDGVLIEGREPAVRPPNS